MPEITHLAGHPEVIAWCEDHDLDPSTLVPEFPDETPTGLIMRRYVRDGQGKILVDTYGPVTEPVTVSPKRPFPLVL